MTPQKQEAAHGDDTDRNNARGLPMSAHERLHGGCVLIRGTTINAFVIQAALKETEEVIEGDWAIRLSEESARRITGLLDNPPAPNMHLRNAAAAYGDRVRDET